MKKPLCLSLFLLLFLASFAFGQRDGITTFSAADTFSDGAVNLVTLVPSFNLKLIGKSQGALPGSIAIESPQSCSLLPNAQGTNYQTFCGGGHNNLASMYFIPNEVDGMGSDYVNTYVGGINKCYQVTIHHLIGSDNLSSYSIPSTTLSAQSGCGSTSATVTTNDGTGITATLTASGSAGGMLARVTALHNASGWVWGGQGTGMVSDPFGNNVTYAGASPTPFTDTLGAVTNLTFAANVGWPTNYAYTDTTGTTQNITTTNGTPSTFQPLGGCGTLNTGQAVTPLSSINFPDGTKIIFGWDTNNGGLDGLIKSITLRTGGTISYTYGTLWSPCNVWAYNTLTRVTPDGPTQYSMTSSGGLTTTTVLDPGKNKTVYVFIGVPGNPYGLSSNPDYVQSVTRYQNTGSPASPVYALLSSTSYCYNSVCGGANLPTLPITSRQTDEYVGTGSKHMSQRVKTYDSYGNTLTDATTDQITGQTITKTIAYGTLSGGSCVALGNTNVKDHRCTVTTTSGSNQLSQTAYSYNANGALTDRYDWISSTLSLHTAYTPNANGTTASATSPNGQVVNYGYAATGSGGCNGLLPTSTSTTVGSTNIQTSQTWDCNGGVVLKTTDANNHTPAATQYDAMFRPTSVTDNVGFSVSTRYTSNSVTSTPSFGTVSASYVDSLGRQIISQHYHTENSNYDTVSTSYGWNGTNFQTQTSVVCGQSSDQACATVAQTFTTNPAFGPVSVTDVNGGTTSFSRNQNDTSLTAGPPPLNENAKVAQTEVDGFGRTKSVCALETSGGTSCGQVMGGSGIVTSYSYSTASGSSTTQATRGAQTHTAVSDALGRVTSTTTPEAGTVTSYWDSAPDCNYPQNGAIVETKTASGIVTCFWHDKLNRTIGFAADESQPASKTCKGFVYDSISNAPFSAPTGYIGNNIVGRVVEAYTNDCLGHAPYTDEWFSYDADGRVTDVWESTPNAGGYYHTVAVYQPNGTLQSIDGVPSYPALFYGYDYEGRLSGLNQQGPVVISSGVTYNPDQSTNTISYPGGDTDSFGYNAIGLMTSYKATVNSVSESGALTWNSNGTLQQLAITDGFNAGGSQTCNFLYDDVGRLGIPPNSPPPPPSPTQYSVDCGSSLWRQVFSYDQYDNLTKTANPGTSWTPGYNSANNQITGATYDADGHVKYDGVNSYTWDAFGKMSGVRAGATAPSCPNHTGNYCVTYDAFGRIVETNNGTTTRQILYSPIGRLANMNGQTTLGEWAPIPGGSTLYAAGTSGTTRFILHPDWLGTKRLGTNFAGTRGYYFDTAYAPYGEQYDSFNATNIKIDFTGDHADIFAGLYDTPNRELMSNAGRWLSPDPARSSWNAYAYPTDPNRQTDPSGLFMSTKQLDKLWQTMVNDYVMQEYWQVEAILDMWSTFQRSQQNQKERNAWQNRRNSVQQGLNHSAFMVAGIAGPPFVNQLPSRLAQELSEMESLGVTPLSPGDPGFTAAAERAGGEINWTLSADGELLTTPALDGVTHAATAGGVDVTAAGTAQVASADGETMIIEITANSGHYMNGASAAQSETAVAAGATGFAAFFDSVFISFGAFMFQPPHADYGQCPPGGC